jgi:hypothetical protein
MNYFAAAGNNRGAFSVFSQAANPSKARVSCGPRQDAQKAQLFYEIGKL